MPGAGDFPQASQILIQPWATADGGKTYTAPTSGGRSYQIDTSFEPYRRQSTRHTTIQSQRESINLEGKTGEGTVNTEGLWRTQMPDWSYGAGQIYADRAGSVANRFLASTGVNVFAFPNQATLLNKTIQVNQQQNNAAPLGVSLGPYNFWSYTGEVLWTKGSWDSPTNLNFTGSDFAGGEIILGLMVDQHALYIGTTKALYQANVLDGASPATAVKVISQGCIPVGAYGGRYFVSGWTSQNVLFDVTEVMNATTAPVLPTGSGAFANGQLVVHPNPKWGWRCMALVDGTFYFSGQPLDNDSALVPNSTGEVWRTSYQGTPVETGTANGPLPAPQIALSLPPGEVVASMFQYGNLCLLGTTQGVRVCRSVSANDPEGNTGDLIAGPIIPNLTQPVTVWVTGFTANNRYVWFTWIGYDDSFVGGDTTPDNSVVIGRLDMETMVDDLTPAYASDLVFPTPKGYIASMWWDPITAGPAVGIELAESGNGVWVQNVNELVSQGFIDSGLVTNNIPDDKIAAMVSARWLGSGSVSFEIQADGNGYNPATPLSPNTPSSTPTLLTTLVRYEELNVQIQLNAGSADAGPTLKRATLKSLPAVVSGTDVSYVVMLYTQVGSHGIKRQIDPYAELAWLESLRLSQQPVLISEGNPNQTLYQATAVVDSIDWLPEHERDAAPYFGWDGVAVVYFKTLVG